MQLTCSHFRVPAALSLAVLLVACTTRGDVISEEYMTLELDGRSLVLPGSVTALPFGSTRRVHTLSVSAREREDLRSQGFFFQLGGEDLRPGTYTIGGGVVHVNYHGEAARDTLPAVYAANLSLGTPFTVTLTAIGSDGVQGTFSGTLRRGGDGPGPELMTVSNGRFSARYRRDQDGVR
ncbi:hypothetical protein V3391_13325 [Luteimonas sp. SMYT11W]|uniref:Lipoprotein n=1 Tax=Luteimonas flava TaxID=3115822 RepID=A0ABU7WGU0_9GAMM